MSINHTTHPEKIAYDLRGVSVRNGEVQVAGWAISTRGSVSFSVVGKSGEVPVSVRRTHLVDVSRAVLNDDSAADCGFRISFENTGETEYTLILSDGERKRTEKFSTEEVYRRKKWRPRAAEEYLKSLSEIPAALKEEGFSRFSKELSGDAKNTDNRYEKWLQKHLASEEELKKERETVFPYAPKISIVVPAYKTPEWFLREMIENFTAQTYSNLELCIADGSPDDSVQRIVTEYREVDCRIAYKKLTENTGISGNTNEALSLATGEWVGLMDHDDLVEPNLLFEAVRAMNEDRDISVIYTDEGKVSMDGKWHFSPSFKPDFDGTALAGGNYICHFFMVKKAIIDRVGGFDPACDGAQDLDFILRCTEGEKVYHLPKILYHWRCHPNSTADDPESKMYCYEAGKRAVEKHAARMGMPADVEICSVYGHYMTLYRVPDCKKKVTVVVTGSGDREAFLKTKASVLSNGAEAEYEFLQGTSGLSEATGEYLFFITEGTVLKPFDMELLSERMLPENFRVPKTFPYNAIGRIEYEHAAAVGFKVTDADSLLLYAGAYKNPEHGVDFVPHGVYKNTTLFGGKYLDARETASVSGHGFFMRKDLFLKMGGLRAEFGAFAETDLCFRLSALGEKMIYEPFTEVQIPKKEPKKPLYLREKAAARRLTEAHGAFLQKEDPALNTNCMIHLGRWVLKD